MEFKFYTTSSGKEVVDEEFSSIPSIKTQKLLGKKILYYEQKTFYQFNHGREIEKIKNSNLWEIKFRISPPYRAICLMIGLNTFLILHLFKKDYDDEIDQATIKIAKDREKDYK